MTFNSTLVKDAKDAFIRYENCGNEDDLKLALSVCKTLGASDDFMKRMEAAMEKARTERPDRIKAWQAIPVEERKAIMEMSRS